MSESPFQPSRSGMVFQEQNIETQLNIENTLRYQIEPVKSSSRITDVTEIMD